MYGCQAVQLHVLPTLAVDIGWWLAYFWALTGCSTELVQTVCRREQFNSSSEFLNQFFGLLRHLTDTVPM